MSAFWQEIAAHCAARNIALYKTDRESGKEQFEIALAPAGALKTASDTAALKSIVETTAAAHRMIADFAARPFANQPGSGLHIHVHLADREGGNVYFKHDETMSDALRFSLGGLLSWLNPCMAVFAPADASCRRFTQGSNAPLTVSWGGNNRTAALRLPDSEHHNKRIEHRVAGADADPGRVIAVILAALHYGLSKRCDPGGQIFGDAALPVYNLPRLIATREEAAEALRRSILFEGYFSVSDLLPAA